MKVPVYIQTTASKMIGHVEIESPDEYIEAADDLWESQNWDVPTLCHHCSTFELGEWEIPEDEDLSYYFPDAKDK